LSKEFDLELPGEEFVTAIKNIIVSLIGEYRTVFVITFGSGKQLFPGLTARELIQ